jgi:hypothetical protein
VSSTRSRSLPDHHRYGYGYEHKSSREGTVDGSVTRERLALHNKPPSVRGRMHAMPTSTTASGTSPNKPNARYTAFAATGSSGGSANSGGASAVTSVGSARHPTMSPPLSAGSYGQLPSIDENFEAGDGEEEKSEYDGTSAVSGRRLGTKSHDIEAGEAVRRHNDLKV